MPFNGTSDATGVGGASHKHEECAAQWVCTSWTKRTKPAKGMGISLFTSSPSPALPPSSCRGSEYLRNTAGGKVRKWMREKAAPFHKNGSSRYPQGIAFHTERQAGRLNEGWAKAKTGCYNANTRCRSIVTCRGESCSAQFTGSEPRRLIPSISTVAIVRGENFLLFFGTPQSSQNPRVALTEERGSEVRTCPPQVKPNMPESEPHSRIRQAGLDRPPGVFGEKRGDK
jgi:hypothetical protein